MNEITLISKRLERERRTIGIMIDLYCRKIHGTYGVICFECNTLQSYAFQKLLICPFNETKPVCSNCIVHCYKPDMRQRVKDIMRFSGPRMVYRHPYLAVMHIIDGWIYKPISIQKKNS